MTTLTFDGAVNVAVGLAREHYGEVALLCATGTPSSGSAETALDIDRLCVTCAAPENRTIFLYSNAWGEFGAPTVIDHPVLGSQPVAWPIQFDLPDAIQVLRQAGYNQPFNCVTLRQPLYPGVNQADFFFQLNDGTCISVGCADHIARPAGVAPVTIA